MQSNTPRSEVENFSKALAVVAHMAQFKLEDMVTEFWIGSLRPHGLGLATKTLLEIARAIKPGRMPSVLDVIEKMGKGEVSDETKAIDVAGRIVEAVHNIGYARWPDAAELIGEIGQYVVRLGGGWEAICEDVNQDNLTAMRAQWRDQALAAIRKQRNGELDLAPRFEEIGGSENPFLKKAIEAASGKGSALQVRKDP